MTAAHMSMMTLCVLPSSVQQVDNMTITIFSAIVFTPVTATGLASWLRVKGLLGAAQGNSMGHAAEQHCIRLGCYCIPSHI